MYQVFEWLWWSSMRITSYNFLVVRRLILFSLRMLCIIKDSAYSSAKHIPLIASITGNFSQRGWSAPSFLLQVFMFIEIRYLGKCSFFFTSHQDEILGEYLCQWKLLWWLIDILPPAWFSIFTTVKQHTKDIPNIFSTMGATFWRGGEGKFNWEVHCSGIRKRNDMIFFPCCLVVHYTDIFCIDTF